MSSPRRELDRGDAASPPVECSDRPVLTEEPHATLPVGRHGDQAVILTEVSSERPGADLHEVAVRRLSHLPDLAGGGRGEGAVAVVEKEVGAAADIGERVPAGRGVASRHGELGDRFQRFGVDEHHGEALEAAAQRDDPALGVKRHRGALADAVAARGDRQVPPERATDVVGVGAVGVVVHAAGAVGGQKRVLRHARMGHRFPGRRSALELRDQRVGRQRWDRATRVDRDVREWVAGPDRTGRGECHDHGDGNHGDGRRTARHRVSLN